MKNIILFLIIPVFIFAQNSLNVTGRASLNTLYFNYDEKSNIKPDSVASKDYSKTSLIPGLQQLLNLAVFARSTNFDVSLLSDIRNNKWDKIDFSDHNSIDRFSLNVRFRDHEFIAGDFFESGSEFFMQSREIRGAKINLQFNNLWNPRSFFNVKTLAGISQKSIRQGGKLPSIYKQYETSGQYNRQLVSASARIGETGLFRSGLLYLYAKDDEKSIPGSLNEPLATQNMGADAALIFWDSKIQLFGEGYYSRKDTIDFGGTNDYSYKSGVDFRYNDFKMIAFYQRLGFNYYSAGYPFLLNDREGFKAQGAYSFPGIVYLASEYEQYNNNLEEESGTPTTDTRISQFSATTNFKNWPELTLLFGYRDDLSNSILSSTEPAEEIQTDKISLKYEARLSYNFNQNRFSLSTIYLDLDDRSKIAGGAPLGTEQLISSFNFYARPANSFFISGGVVYSRLILTDGKDNRNIFAYQSNRWDVLNQKLFLESNLNISSNDARNGGNDDLLNDYMQVDGQLSIEYFFNSNISLKLIGGTNARFMKYTTETAVQLLQDVNQDIDPAFFNGNESYNAIIYGAEINWIF
jgi:hypothetical protein